MGKRIDRAAGAALAATALYLLFLNAWDSIPLACAAAFAGCVLLRRLAAGRPRRQRLTRLRAEAELLRIAALPDDEGAAALESLIRDRYPGEDFRVVPALKHPEGTLNSGDVLNLWKASRDARRIVIAATCACDPRAALFARELRSPAAVVVDRRALLKALRRRGPQPDASPDRLPAGQLLRRACRRVAARRPAPKDGLIAAAMLAMYLLGGSTLYLLCALAMLFRSGAWLIESRGRPRLFG